MAAQASGERKKIVMLALTSGNQQLLVTYGTFCKTFSLQPPFRVEKFSLGDERGPFRYIDKAAATDVIAYVTEKKPRNFVLYNGRSRDIALNLQMPQDIVSVKMNKKRIAICLEDNIYVYEIPQPKSSLVYHRELATASNPDGVLALSHGPDGIGYLAYPSSNGSGQATVTSLMPSSSVISTSNLLHNHPLRVMTFSHDGSLMASASTNGNILRIWSCPELGKLYEFRRGLATPVTVDFLSFSSSGCFVMLGSSSPTVHVFKIPPDPAGSLSEESQYEEETSRKEQSLGGWLGQGVKSLWDTARNAVDEYVLPSSWCTTQMRSYARAYVPEASANFKKVAVLLQNTDPHRLVVVTDNGILYAFWFDLTGGDLNLAFQTDLTLTTNKLLLPREDYLKVMGAFTDPLVELVLSRRRACQVKAARARTLRGIQHTSSDMRKDSINGSPKKKDSDNTPQRLRERRMGDEGRERRFLGPPRGVQGAAQSPQKPQQAPAPLPRCKGRGRKKVVGGKRERGKTVSKQPS